MPYREPGDVPAVDLEQVAVKELSSRASRLRKGIMLPSIVAGLVGTVLGYLLVRELQFALFNAQIPWLSGVVGGLPPFSAALRISQKLGDAAVSRRARAWADEQVRIHALPPGVLDDYLTVL